MKTMHKLCLLFCMFCLFGGSTAYAAEPGASLDVQPKTELATVANPPSRIVKLTISTIYANVSYVQALDPSTPWTNTDTIQGVSIVPYGYRAGETWNVSLFYGNDLDGDNRIARAEKEMAGVKTFVNESLYDRPVNLTLVATVSEGNSFKEIEVPIVNGRANVSYTSTPKRGTPYERAGG